METGSDSAWHEPELSSRDQVGFDPYLRAWPSHSAALSDHTTTTEKVREQLGRPVQPLVGSYFEFPEGILEFCTSTIGPTAALEASSRSPSTAAMHLEPAVVSHSDEP